MTEDHEPAGAGGTSTEMDVAVVGATTPTTSTVNAAGPVMTGTVPTGEEVLVPLRDQLKAVSAQFGWDQAGLAVTDPEVLSRLTHRVMSASTMASMNGCPSRWAFEKMWPGDPDPFTPALIGNGAHTVLERLYERPPDNRTMDAAMIIARHVSVEQFPGGEPLSLAVRDRWLAELYAAFKGVFEIEDPTRVVVEGRELKVETTIAGVGFVGFIDRLERNGDGGLVVVDYKTSRALPKDITRFGDEHGDQQRLYELALQQVRGELPDEAWLYYTRLGKSKKVAQSKARLAETRDRFVLAAERLALIGETGVLPVSVTPLCGWCPLVNVCPAAAKEGKGDRTGNAVEATWLPIPTIGRPAYAPWPAGLPAPDVETLALEAALQGWDPERADASDHADAVVDAADGSCAAAHNGSIGDPSERSLNVVGVIVTRLKEGQPYVEQADGDLNPNSYAATAVSDVVETAVYTLDRAGIPLTRSGVAALSSMLASVILDVQRSVTGTSSWQDGMNARARFLVKRIMRSIPAPVHGDAVAWDEWAGKVAKRAGLMWAVAYGLWSDGPDGDPPDLADHVATTITEAKSRQGARPKQATVLARSVELGEPAEPKRAAGHDQTDRILDGSAPADADGIECFDENGGFGDFAD